MANIAIVGLGNLGSRHLQGLASCTLPLSIYLYDPSANSLATARQRWEEAGGNHGGHILLNEPLPHYDIAIVATTADKRPGAVVALADVAEVRAWLLEKPLAQSVGGAQQISARIGTSPAWVNLPRRAMPWHQAIKHEVSLLEGPLKVIVSGGPWGLACNATHFVDLVRWWTDAKPVVVDTAGLDAYWHQSKRPGYVDVYGSLQILYSDGTQLRLESTPDGGPHVIDILAVGQHLRIVEGQSNFYRNGIVIIHGRMDLQSTLTGSIVEVILEGGEPPLPTLAEAVGFERLLLEGLIPMRAASGGPVDRLDIT